MAKKQGLSLLCRACCNPVIDNWCECGGPIERLCLSEMTEPQIKILERGTPEEVSSLEIQLRPGTMYKAVSCA